MASNNFRIFNQGYLDIMPDEAYDKDQQRLVGVAPGIAEPDLHNKLYRQATTLNWALAEVIKESGYDALDYDPTGLVTSLKGAIQAVALGGSSLAFKGYVSPTAPTDPALKVRELWITGTKMPTVFPVTGVQQWDGTQWTAAEDYTPDRLDWWADLNDNHGYYWFSDEWNISDSHVDLAGYVDTASNQAIAGEKSFADTLTASGMLKTTCDMQHYSAHSGGILELGYKSDNIQSLEITNASTELKFTDPAETAMPADYKKTFIVNVRRTGTGAFSLSSGNTIAGRPAAVYIMDGSLPDIAGGEILKLGLEIDPELSAIFVHILGKISLNMTLDFNTMGGTAIASIIAPGATAVTLSAEPTRSGYTFNGWNTQADGMGTDYPTGSSIILVKNTTLYAKWR